MKKGAIEWESNQESALRMLSLSWIFDFVRLLSCGYWSQVRISYFDDQKTAFQGGVKCEKSAADRS